MNYHIVATLGPSSDCHSVWQGLLAAGCSSFRINTSHVTGTELESLLDRLQIFLKSQADPVPVILDLQGSKWRLGRFSSFELKTGGLVELVHAEHSDQPCVLPVPHMDFFSAAFSEGGEILLNDAKSRIAIESVFADHLVGRVLMGGAISARKGIALPGSTFRQETLGERDKSIVQKTRGLTNIGYAISFIKDSIEMASYRTLLGSQRHLVGKLERATAMMDADAIAASANELWVCRGDLGAEMGLPAMAEIVAEYNQRLRGSPVPVYLAGQVLEHMTSHPNPTRSEVCHLYDMITRGYHGIVLSDETAIGQFPVESCKAAALFFFSVGRAWQPR